MPHSTDKSVGKPIRLAFQESWRIALEEWREESIPERDGLLGDTEGDNAAHVVVRGELLQLVFDDDSIDERINSWVEATPLRHESEHAIEAISQLAEVAGIPWLELDWDEENGFIIESNKDLPAPVSEGATSAFRSYLSELKSFNTSDAYRRALEDTLAIVQEIGLPYRWLAIEILMVYFARLTVPGFIWQFRDCFVVEDTAEDWPAPDVGLAFRTLPDETVKEAVDRLNFSVEQAMSDLTRFQEVLPQGKTPNARVDTLKKYTGWLYRHKVRGESIRSIAREEFPDDLDRRKDVRGGIRRAEDLLSLGN